MCYDLRNILCDYLTTVTHYYYLIYVYYIVLTLFLNTNIRIH